MKQLKIQLLFLLTILVSQITWSQASVKGTVYDVNSNPIENAHVLLEPSNLAFTTNSNGEFIVQNISSGNYILTISYLGFKTIEQTIEVKNADNTLTFNLEPDLLNLQTVVVTGTFDPRKSLESSTSVSSLNSKEMQQTFPRGSANLLQNIPGTFTDASAGEVFTRIYTRGISASAEDDMGWYYVSLQEDGLPVSLVQHSYYSPDLFHRADLTTKKVEAIRGGSSSITALNGPGGIYNFISNGISQNIGGEVQLTRGFQGNNNNALYRIDTNIGGPLENNWYFNIGGHFRKDDGARDANFTFSKGGQLKFNIIKKGKNGHFKFYGKVLDDHTNRYHGVAATNWDNPTPAFGQEFSSTSLLMPSFDANIPDGRNVNKTNRFNPSKGVHTQDFAFGMDIQQNTGNNWTLKNNLKFSAKQANWQTSISNAFVSLNDPTAYVISDPTAFFRNDAILPFGQVVFKDALSGSEIARVDNSGLFSGSPFQYLTGGMLPNDAIMGTSAWYKDMDADEWMNQFTLQKKTETHDFTFGFAAGLSKTNHFTQGSFGYVTYEPNPRMLQVTLENPSQPIVALSDENGVSSYGSLFYVNTSADITQLAGFVNDRWKVADNLHLDLGLRYETIKHKGSKDRFAPLSLSGGIDGDNTTLFDNGTLGPTGEKDDFDYNYNYLSYSIGVNYSINDNTVIFSRLSKGNKAPELNYYFNNFSNVPINGKGEIQKINQLELGIKLSSKNASFTGTAFWSQLKDIGTSNFELDDNTNTLFYTPIQFNTSKTLGFEWESVFTPINNISINFDGVLQDPKADKWKVYDAGGTANTDDDTIHDFSGNTLAFNPKLMFNLGSTFERNRLLAFFKWQYMGEREGNVSNGFQLAAYSTFNTGIGYKINKHWSVDIVVSNLFNSEGLANFFGAISFGASGSGATPEFIQANPDASFVVVPILPRSSLIKLNYVF
ncbi:TonB-dependent receptor [Seonamhaeicola maritimus]|uniref:TonB-dependent receptor n=1 Tax=Seonamhaeicola maritimus TaxID=2591822 RepID=A0A5C7GJE1_9FLAO|nr:TonB-dependent receptor [Seonamhaeicola maritimus]TXG38488.1 TonB-dependent receptor [Seonamhaeicola maritimus]